MRLINTSSLELLHVVDSAQEVYVILSHTWGNEEVSLQELGQQTSRSKSGFDKIEKTCSIARKKGIDWAWVDTCCIDKTSSAELSEAINSMFTWYHDSGVCLVHLEDLKPIPTWMKNQGRQSFLNEHLPQCRWFTRGWTLQELIASPNVEFYDQAWNLMGTKSDLEQILSQTTHIDSLVLRDNSRLREIPVARRMSWASKRQTTRKEDVAYCLLGIFDINMPLLYGEGEKAFLRLQDAIAAETNDLSLFAWQREGGTAAEEEQIMELELGYKQIPSRFGGIFASSPLDFGFCTTIKRHKNSTRQIGSVTSVAGDCVTLRTDLLRIRDVVTPAFFDYHLLDLGCVETSERTNWKPQWLSIYIHLAGPEYLRAVPDMVALHASRVKWDRVTDRRPPGRAPESIRVRKRLHSREQVKFNAFLGSQITFELRGSVPAWIMPLALEGFPKALFEDTGPIDFTFHNPGYEDLDGMVNFKLDVWLDEYEGDGIPIGGTIHCLIICGLEWNENHIEPWAAIYAQHDSLADDVRELTNEIINHSLAPEDSTDHKPFNAIRDIMLREYSDVSGNMVQKMMPQSVLLPGGCKLSLTHERAAGDEAQSPDSGQKRSKNHVVWIQFHEVAEPEGKN